MYPDRIAFTVPGVPIPQGSKTVVPAKKGHRATLRDSNDKLLRPWRKKVRSHAEDATRYVDTITDPVRVWVRFCFDRPPSHYRTGRNAHLLKDGAPLYPSLEGNGDVDKLQRAIFDACTDAGVWKTDAQVVDVRARKFYAGEDELALPEAGVLVVVEPITHSSPADASSPVRAAGEAPTTTGALF